MKLAITGASGHLGRQVTALVLGQVPAADVVLLTRNPDGLADAAARGAEVRPADFNDPAGLAVAFKGIDRLLLISTDSPDQSVVQHRAAIDAAVAAGVQHVVYTSQFRPEEGNPAGSIPGHRETEGDLRVSPLRMDVSAQQPLRREADPHCRPSGRLGTARDQRGGRPHRLRVPR